MADTVIIWIAFPETMYETPAIPITYICISNPIERTRSFVPVTNTTVLSCVGTDTNSMVYWKSRIKGIVMLEQSDVDNTARTLRY